MKKLISITSVIFLATIALSADANPYKDRNNVIFNGVSGNVQVSVTTINTSQVRVDNCGMITVKAQSANQRLEVGGFNITASQFPQESKATCKKIGNQFVISPAIATWTQNLEELNVRRVNSNIYIVGFQRNGSVEVTKLRDKTISKSANSKGEVKFSAIRLSPNFTFNGNNFNVADLPTKP